MNLKQPTSFSCDKCNYHNYYLVKRKNGYLLICKKCGTGFENKQPSLFVLLTLEDNKYPQYIKFHTLPNYKGEPIESYLKEKCIFNASTVINCDGDRTFLRLKKLTQLKNSAVDYTKEKHKIKLLNTFFWKHTIKYISPI